MDCSARIDLRTRSVRKERNELKEMRGKPWADTGGERDKKKATGNWQNRERERERERERRGDCMWARRCVKDGRMTTDQNDQRAGQLWRRGQEPADGPHRVQHQRNVAHLVALAGVGRRQVHVDVGRRGVVGRRTVADVDDVHVPAERIVHHFKRAESRECNFVTGKNFDLEAKVVGRYWGNIGRDLLGIESGLLGVETSVDGLPVGAPGLDQRTGVGGIAVAKGGGRGCGAGRRQRQPDAVAALDVADGGDALVAPLHKVLQRRAALLGSVGDRGAQVAELHLRFGRHLSSMRQEGHRVRSEKTSTITTRYARPVSGPRSLLSFRYVH